MTMRRQVSNKVIGWLRRGEETIYTHYTVMAMTLDRMLEMI